MKNLRGPKGTTVKLEILRKTAKNPLFYEVTRGDIPVNSVDAAYMLDDKSGYIKSANSAKPLMTNLLQPSPNYTIKEPKTSLSTCVAIAED